MGEGEKERKRRTVFAEPKYPSFRFVPRGWARAPSFSLSLSLSLSLTASLSLSFRTLRSASYYYYFLSQYLLFPHSVLC